MKRTLPILIIIAGLASLYPMQRWVDGVRPQAVESTETLFMSSGEAIKKMSLGLEGLAADIYWIRTIQYFGRKLIDSGKPLSMTATKDLYMPLLAPLLNIVVTLDPHHIPAYRFGAIFLPERDMDAAIALLEKGIRENPAEWRLYQDIGYIYWQRAKEATGEEATIYYEKAAEYYDLGSKQPGARSWMADLAGLMRIREGSRDERETARRIYEGYLESDDKNIRAQAEIRLRQIIALDQIDAINALLAELEKRTGKCLPDLRPVGRGLMRARSNDPVLMSLNQKEREVLLGMRGNISEDGTPLDPEGFPYALNQQTCKAELSPESTVAR
ncbi:MAG TPA: hypothetical protein VNN73_12325 [Blastocatellia bacterium]|nr:hypothetical protein [Blastocatellia bacterium]